MELTLVAAVDRDGAIGTEDGVPWDYPEDVRQYRERVAGHPVVLGRRTFEEMDRDPPGERAVVLTRDAGYDAGEGVVASSPAEALDLLARADDDAYVLGGEAIYRAFVPYATRAAVTELPERSGGSKYFPYLGAGWEVERTVGYANFEVVEYVNGEPARPE